MTIKWNRYHFFKMMAVAAYDMLYIQWYLKNGGATNKMPIYFFWVSCWGP